MSAVEKLFEYLPVRSEYNDTYFAPLKEAFEDNYERRHHRTAFFTFHLLYMSSFYTSAWQIRTSRPDKFDALVNSSWFMFGPKEKENYKEEGPLIFSRIKESRIFEILDLIGCGEKFINACKDTVDKRNKITHANGHNVLRSSEETDAQLKRMLYQLETIQKSMKSDLHECLRIFLTKGNYYGEGEEYLEPESIIRDDLLNFNYFSKADMQTCLDFDLQRLEGEEHFEKIRELFYSFVEYCEKDRDIMSPKVYHDLTSNMDDSV